MSLGGAQKLQGPGPGVLGGLCLRGCCSEQASAASILTSFTAFWSIFTQTQQNDLKKNKRERNKKKVITAALAHAQNLEEFLSETC